MVKAFDNAVKLERVQFVQPFNEAYETANKQLCIKNAPKWVNAR